ncbi:autotransporter assembly complex protein TamA [Mergibacter septicus]|uniref:autotransporter assembly complex protein TamA n=1 Tax=Mergibacter septicus TaxID=221402 RepID=UPI00223EE4D4|nr:autotransporter assembly complex family protein [Mergibacter septicus]
MRHNSLLYMLSCAFFLTITPIAGFTTTYHSSQETLTFDSLKNLQTQNYTVELKVQGINNQDLNNNIKLYLAALNTTDAEDSERYRQLVSENIDQALRALGYFNSRIEFTLHTKTKTTGVLIATVKLMEPVRIAAINIKLEGEAKDNPVFQALLKDIPQKGTILNQETYENYKDNLKKTAVSLGYFNAKFEHHQLEVNPDKHAAYWQLVFNSGNRYKYGKITFEGAQIRDDYLTNMLQIKSGDPYSLQDISKLTADFSSTNWFRSVVVQPSIQPNDLINLKVLMQPRPKNRYEIGIGYASDIGPRLQFGWKKPWINSRGQSFSSNLYLSSPKQTIEMLYQIPLSKNPLNYYYEIAIGGERERDKDTKTQALTLATLRYWNRENGWQTFAGVKVRRDNFTQGGLTEQSMLIYPTIGFNRTRIRGGLFPTWGDSQKIQLDIGQKLWKSDINFYRLQASTTWLRTFATKHRLITRASLGYLATNNFDKIPPTLRFFAGGDRSIRGYSYNSIAPRNHNGKLIGGTRLFTASLEYQYQLLPKWWGAIYYDAGFAANNFSPKNLRKGAGVGVRWHTPIGAVKFDVATPVNTQRHKNKNIEFYIGLGAEL